MRNRIQKTFRELIDAGHLQVGDGYRTKQAEHGQPGLPILRVAEVLDGRIDPKFEDFVSDDYRPAMGPKISRPADIVLTTKGTVGRVAIVPPEGPEFVYSPQVCFFRTMSTTPLVGRYLYYWFKSEQFWSQARSLKGQTDMADYINLADIKSLKIALPQESVQQSVVAILGALDDKIAVNDRIAAKGNDLAASLLDQVLAEDEERSDVLLSDVALVNQRKVTPIPGDYVHYIDISSVSLGNIEWPLRMPWGDAPGRARRGVSPGDTIWSTVRPGRRSFALILEEDPELVVSTGFAVLTPVKVGPAFLYEVTKRGEFVQYLESVAEGSAYPAVRAERFEKATIPLPSPSRLKEFEDAAMALRRRVNAAQRESRPLARLRDMILPKLMSGKIRVRDAERVVEDAT